MKKASIAALVAACLMVCGAACAQGTLRLDGAIEAGQTLTIPAPYSGMTGDSIVRAGDELAAGETLFTISATEITADCDGVVAALYAQLGDSAAYITGRYGALAYLEQGVVYTGDCTISGAASDRAGLRPLGQQQQPQGHGARHQRERQGLYAGGGNQRRAARGRADQGLPREQL